MKHCSDVTSNSGAALDKYPTRARPPSLPPPSYPFSSHPSLPLHALPSPSSPPYSQPFPSPSLSPFPLITARGSGEGCWSPSGPGRQTHFCANHSPESANLLNYLKTKFLAWNSGVLAQGAPLDSASLPAPLLRRREAASEGSK